MTLSEQLRLAPEGAHESGAALHGAQVSSGSQRQVLEVARAEVRHSMVFEISPDVFDRVELRRIGGQELKSDGPRCASTC